MIVSCKGCGKQYSIKTEHVKGNTASFKCKACGATITIQGPAGELTGQKTSASSVSPSHGQEKVAASRKTTDSGKAAIGETSRSARKGIGLRGKLLVFLLLPLMMALLVRGYLSLKQVDDLAGHYKTEGASIVAEMAERQIADHSRSVAMQVKLYLLNHPDVEKADFAGNGELRKIAVQKVGLTGYSSLYELPGEDGVWRTWADADLSIVGIDMSTLRKSMGSNFMEFWKIFTGVKVVEESIGYFTWSQEDGSLKRKFMACTPVAGTRFIIASSTYLDEFLLPLKRLERTNETIARRARSINAAGMIGTTLLIGLIAFLFGRSVTNKVSRLSAVADRISTGELNVEVDIKSKDEIGELAESVSRMQDSLRLAIERLRKGRQ